SNLSNGDVVSFYLRMSPFWFGSLGYEALELRLAHGESCSPGGTPEGVGDFATRLLTLDPLVYKGPYSNQEVMSHSINPRWGEHGAVIRGLPDGEHAGCLAIRRATPVSLWFMGYVGIDDFSIREDTAVPGEVAFFDNYFDGTASAYSPYMRVRGRADPGSTVSIYMNATCSGEPFATVSSDEFDWPGVSTWSGESNSAYTVSATSTDGSGKAPTCSAEGLTYLWDTLAPTTSDDVGEPDRNYPGPATLSAVDAGHGVSKTYYSVGVDPQTPTTSSPVYNPGSRPVLLPGEKISYFSVDRSGNVEAVKTSQAVPVPPPIDPEPGPADEPTVTVPKGDVNAKGAASARIRPASESLTHKRGRVSVTLVCDGDAGSPPCAGSLAILATFGATEKLITPRPVRFSLPAGAQKVITLALSRDARIFAARKPGALPWTRIKIKSDGAGSQSFRRKIRL
ncbi:MAG: chitobiase/beta-hexosaminidase C-terminal domain-containing protein, partial [Solirubrobacterales bacterium]